MLEIDLCNPCKSGTPYLCENNNLESEQFMETGGGLIENWKYHEKQLMMAANSLISSVNWKLYIQK